MENIQPLIDYIKNLSCSYLMFSGGLDSCAILGAARLGKTKVTPVWINNCFGRANEDDIRKQAKNFGVEKLNVIKLEPLNQVIQNPEDRCYHCKNQIINAIKTFDPNAVILDGTTGSDTGYRPGKKALHENGVISPLAELGITSAQAKEMAIYMGANKDIAEMESCLATRINYNLPLDDKYLDTIKNIELAVIQETKDYNVRCRIDDIDHIRIELSSDESFKAILNNSFRNKLIKLGEKVAMFTTIDLKPSRPNSYDNRIKKV